MPQEKNGSGLNEKLFKNPVFLRLIFLPSNVFLLPPSLQILLTTKNFSAENL